MSLILDVLMSALAFFKCCRPIGANSFGWVCFQLGILLLPSTALISGVLLVLAFTIGFRHRSQPFLKDAWNQALLILTLMMMIGCFRAYSGWLAWVGLGNWLPFFCAFWGFQPYLETGSARRRCGLWFVVGTIPVVITGFGQIWLGWQGPWEIMNGLIIWFVSPGGEPLGRLSGLFDYANIAGAWLCIAWPFCLASFLQPNIKNFRRILFFLFAVAVVVALILTDSRNAWGGLILAVPFVLGPAKWFWLLPLLALVLLPLMLAVVPGINTDLQNLARLLVPEKIWGRLNDLHHAHTRILASTRLSQWSVALTFVLERPWFGWGAAAFSVLYPLRTGLWHGHAHNLPLEMAVSHGLPATFCLMIFVGTLLVVALRRGVLLRGVPTCLDLKNKMFDRSWWAAAFVLLALHGLDMPFFDSRLNLAGWIFLAGLRCIIRPVSINKQETYSLPDGDELSIVL